jgi:hypothetical protein
MVEVDLQFLLGLVSGGFAIYLIVKYRLHQARKFLDLVDDAIYDDKVSEDEFRAIWEAGKDIVYGKPPAPPA